MGLLDGLLGGVSQMRDYNLKARLAMSQGLAQKNAAYAQATQIERAAYGQARLANLNMMRMRSNQRQAEGAVRAQRAGSGFDQSTGTGTQAEDAVRRAADMQVSDAALSSSIAQGQARDEAISYRRQGDAAMRAAEAEADQYRRALRSTRSGMWAAGVSSVFSGLSGGLMAYNAGGDARQVGLSVGQGLDAGFSMGSAFNPFMAKYASKGWQNTISQYLMQ